MSLGLFKKKEKTQKENDVKQVTNINVGESVGEEKSMGNSFKVAFDNIYQHLNLLEKGFNQLQSKNLDIVERIKSNEVKHDVIEKNVSEFKSDIKEEFKIFRSEFREDLKGFKLELRSDLKEFEQEIKELLNEKKGKKF